MSSIILSKKNRLDEEGYIVIQYTKDGKTKRKSLKFKMTETHFNKTFDKEFQRFKRTTLFDYQKINSLIDNNFNLDVFTDGVKYNNTFLSYFNSRKDLKRNVSTIKAYESAYNVLYAYLVSIKKVDIKLTDLNKDFVLMLKNYLLDSNREQSTCKAYFNVYKTILNNAIDDNLYRYSNPFNRIEFKLTIHKKRMLNEGDINSLIMVDFENKYFIESRLFLLQFFLNGSRLSDVMLLKNGDISKEEINIVMLKTKQSLPIEMSSEIVRLIYEIVFKSHYRNTLENVRLFDFLRKNKNEYLFKEYINSDIFNDYDKKSHFNLEQYKHYKVLIARYNKNLKELCKQKGLSEVVSSHNARHTFTNQMLKLDNVNVNDIRMMLGHSNLQTTQSYIAVGFKTEKSKDLQREYRSRFTNTLKDKEKLMDMSDEEMKKAYLDYRHSGSVEIIKKKDKK